MSPMNENRTAFETEPCMRCGGSGWFSHCQTWGRTCFECGVHPKQQGIGQRLTRRGRAAHEYYLSLLPTRRAVDLQPGDIVLDSHRLTVQEVVRPTTGAVIRDGVRISEGYVDVVGEKIRFCIVPEEHVYKLLPSNEERQRLIDRALAYQATLTKQGSVRKRYPTVQREKEMAL